MMFSSLLSPWNLCSSRGLVKISANWSLVLTCEITISGIVSKKVVPDVFVFGSRIPTRDVSNLYCTLTVTYERDMVHRVTIVHARLSHP
jgi:hypothetical protein